MQKLEGFLTKGQKYISLNRLKFKFYQNFGGIGQRGGKAMGFAVSEKKYAYFFLFHLNFNFTMEFNKLKIVLIFDIN